MLFSRNPVSGIMESYEDDGVYSGNVFTMGDFIAKEKTANDGGPGSGNFGHGGRPGQIGGSSAGQSSGSETGSSEKKESISFKEPDEPFDIWSWEEEEDTPEEKAAKKEKEEREEREKKERERYGNNGLLEKDYPEDLRLTDKERDLIAGVFRAYKDNDFKSEASADVMNALSGLETEERLNQKESKLKEIVEASTEEINKKKAEGYTYKTHNPQSLESGKQRLARWWNEVMTTGAPQSNWGEKGIRYWQLLRAGALRDIGQINLAKKIVKRDEFAKTQPGYMPWRKNPNRDNPYYKPWENNDMMAEDGGPGSGNFGHKGRPGLVGGSGKGGGIQYRGGRSDIGYFGSRQDWLNGLQGEKQHEAVRQIAKLKKDMGHKKRVKDRIDKAWKDGLITETERQESLKKAGLDKFNEQDSPEVYCMKFGKTEEKRELLDRVREARSWDKRKDKLMEENLSEEERKVYDYIHDHFLEIEGIDRQERMDTIHALEAKAMGIDVPVEISDEMMYQSGAKERPKPPKPEKSGADYSFVSPSNSDASSAAYYMGAAMGETLGYGTGYDPARFEEINKKFIDTMAHTIVSPNQASFYGMNAIRDLRKACSLPAPNYLYAKKDYEYTKENFDRLNDDEKKKLLDIVSAYASIEKGQFDHYDIKSNVEDLTLEDFRLAESAIRRSTPRKKDERRRIQDYILLQEKMLTGAEPTSDDDIAEIKRKEEEKVKAAKEARDKKFKQEQEEFSKGAGKLRKLGCRMASVSFDPKSVLNANTPDEISKAFNDGGFFKDGCAPRINPDIPKGVYYDMATAYQRVVTRYPFLAGELGVFGGISKGSSNGACNKEAYNPSDGEGEIRFNHQDFKNPELQSSRLRGYIARKWMSQIDEGISAAQSTITHELGHALANWLHRTTIGAFEENSASGFDNEVATLLKERTFKALKMKPTYENIKDGLSEYGAASRSNRGKCKDGTAKVKSHTEADEFFAEAFKEGMLSSNPRPIAREFMRQLDLFIKENNITADTSALVSTAMPELLRGKKRYA